MSVHVVVVYAPLIYPVCLFFPLLDQVFRFMFDKSCNFLMSLLLDQDFSHIGTLLCPLCLTELGYCADLISSGNHSGGRKHHLLINKNVSWRFKENDSAPRGLLKRKF